MIWLLILVCIAAGALLIALTAPRRRERRWEARLQKRLEQLRTQLDQTNLPATVKIAAERAAEDAYRARHQVPRSDGPLVADLGTGDWWVIS